MISMIRKGPHIIVVAPGGQALAERLAGWGTERQSLKEAFAVSDEELTIVVFGPTEGILGVSSIERAWTLPAPPEDVLMYLINEGPRECIDTVRSAPHIVLVRALGDIAKAVARAKKDIMASSENFATLIDTKADGTILCFTGAPLGTPVGYEQVWPESLYVTGDYRATIKLLKRYGLRYLNEGLGKDWYDLDIKVYDRYESYDLQLERINFVMDALESGFVTGESWSVDNPRMFMRIDVYRLRFFTYEDPLAVKRNLLGLEYFRDGTRVGDYDLFRGERKVHWSDAAPKQLRERKALGMWCRKALEEKLGPDRLSKLLELDALLAETRKD